MPELTAWRDYCQIEFSKAFLAGRGWYSAMAELQRAEQALQDAQWRLAVESCRWQHRAPLSWYLCTEVRAFVYRNRAVIGPGRELVLRPKAEVAGA